MVSVQLATLILAVAGGGETVLLDFQAPWCAPCRSMEGIVAELDQAGYPVRKVNVDSQKDLANKYHVQSIPCFVLLVDGQEVDRVHGAVRRAELLALFNKNGVTPRGQRDDVARAQSPDARPSRPLLPLANRNPFTPARDAVASAPPSAAPAAMHSAPPVPMHSPPSVGSNGASSQDLIQASVRLTIQDPSGASYGTGTLIDSRNGEALIVTCGHIFRDAGSKGKILVDLFGPGAPQKLEGRLVAYDLKDGQDIGLVSIRPGVPVKVAPVAAKNYRISKGESVTTVGCNNGAAATAVVTKVTGIDKFLGPPNVQVAGMPVQGRSGGGLFNAAGEVIGVCNAADPTDNEGLYAALPAIHMQLDKAGLAMIYQNRPAAGAPSAQLASAAVRGPAPISRPAAASSDPRGGMTDAERATLAEMHRQGDSAEVICVVRSLSNPGARSEVIMLDRASSAFLKQLAADREAQESRHLTSLRKRQQQGR